MAGLPKWIIKKYGMTKKAWSVFRSGAKSSGGGHAKSSGGHSGKHKSGGKKMAKAKHAAKHAAKKFRAGLETRPGKVVKMAVVAAAGGAGTSFVLNKTPKVKDLSQPMKSAIQGGVGIAAVMFGKKRFIKELGAGAIIAAVFGLTKAVLKVDPLAGPGAGTPTLTPEAMRRLTGGRMGTPANVRMGAPANVTMNGGTPSAGWSSGWN